MSYDKKFNYLVSCRPLENNYKFYQAIKKADNLFECNYGRIGTTGKSTPESKSLSEWRKKYSSSVSDKKGYIDRSEYFDLISSEVNGNSNTSFQFTNKEIQDLIIYLLNSSNQTLQENYVFGGVLPNDKLFKRVQELISNIKVNLKINVDIDKINSDYLELISLSQRKISNVKYALFTEIKDNNDLDKAINKIDNEQDLLDNLQTSVQSSRNQIEAELENKKQNTSTVTNSFIDSYNFNIEPITKDEELKIKKLIKESSTTHQKFKTAYKLTHKTQQKIFDDYVSKSKNKSTLLLWHGSKTQNYISIMSKSLMIRPANAGYNGSLFNDGVYFAIDADKSFGYTSGGRWIGGPSSPKQILLLFDVHVGNVYHLKSGTKFDSNTNLIKYCKQNGFDCVHAHSGLNYNSYHTLQRDELIVYSSDQCTPRYLVEFE